MVGTLAGSNGSKSSPPEPPSLITFSIGYPSAPTGGTLWLLTLIQTDSLSSCGDGFTLMQILVFNLASLALSFSVYSFSALTALISSSTFSVSSGEAPSGTVGTSFGSFGGEVAILQSVLYKISMTS